MTRSTLTTIATALAIGAAAQCNDRAARLCGPPFGALGGGAGPDDSSLAIDNANKNPNSTSTVEFNFRHQAQGGSQTSETWRWTVNITEMSSGLLNGSYTTPNDEPNPHFVNTVNTFEWPGGGVLSDHLRNLTNNATDREGGQLCVTVLDLKSLPVNVSNAYQESDGGDCSNALGSECVAAYLSSLSGISGQCLTPGYPKNIPACASTLGTASCFGAATFGLGNSTSSEFLNFTDRSTYPVRSGDAFFFSSTPSQPGANNSYYEDATQQLQAIVISGAAQEMICQKVNKTNAPTPTTSCPAGSNPSGGGSGPSGSATPTNAASAIDVAKYGMASIGGLVALFSLL